MSANASAENTPDNSPKSVIDNVRFAKREKLRENFMEVKLPIRSRQVKNDLESRNIFEPTISKNKQEEIAYRISKEYYITPYLEQSKWCKLRMRTKIYHYDIFLLDDGTAAYSSDELPNGFFITIRVAATRSVDNSMLPKPDIKRYIRVTWSINETHDVNIDYINPSEIIGVVKPEDGQIYNYWKTFIETRWQYR